MEGFAFPGGLAAPASKAGLLAPPIFEDVEAFEVVPEAGVEERSGARRPGGNREPPRDAAALGAQSGTTGEDMTPNKPSHAKRVPTSTALMKGGRMHITRVNQDSNETGSPTNVVPQAC